MMIDKKTKKIQQINDIVRQSFIGCNVVLTVGVRALSDEDREAVLTLVREFNDFNPDNDPYGEHDFGAVIHMGNKYFWKIDYFDLKYEYGSEKPECTTETARVLTVMLADEY